MQVENIWRPNWRKYLLVTLLLTLFVNAKSQQIPYLDRPVTIHSNNASIAELFTLISAQTGIIFSYTQPFNDNQKTTINCDNTSLKLVLDNLLKPLNFCFNIKGKYIIIKANRQTPTELPPNILAGYLYDMRDSSSIAEASVYVKQTKHSAITNGDGYFALSYSAKIPELQISFAKENYKDTSVVIFNKTKQELYVYLFPKQVAKETIVQVVTEPAADTIIVAQSDSTPAPLPRKTHFWEKYGATHPNFRNITDTLFNHLSVSLVPSVSTNKSLSINTINEYSLNGLVGNSKGTTKCEIGGILNIDNGDVQFVQISGVGNIVSGKVTGGQYAGVFNSNNGNVLGGQYAGYINMDRANMTGNQVAGVINIVGGNLKGGQVAGIININKGNTKGGSVAGIANIVKGDAKGAQVAGIINKADSVRGSQVAAICNIARSNSGLQLAALVNRSSYIKGTQLGLINLSDSCDGVAIGLLSLVRHGYHKLEVGTDELGFGTLSFRTGVKRFHNIFIAGANYNHKDVWCYGYGLGSEIQISKHWDFAISATAQQIQKFKGGDIKLNLLNKLYVGLDYSISKKIGFSFGPTLNLMISDTRANDYLSTYDKLAPYSFSNKTKNDMNRKVWVGGQIALRFF